MQAPHAAISPRNRCVNTLPAALNQVNYPILDELHENCKPNHHSEYSRFATDLIIWLFIILFTIHQGWKVALTLCSPLLSTFSVPSERCSVIFDPVMI